MATLAQTLRNNRQRTLVRGPGGSLSEETPEEVQTLAGQAGLQAPPTTPAGIGMIGGNADQQKMAGTPAQKSAALSLASQPVDQTLQGAMRRGPVRSEATAQEQGKIEKSEDMKNLGQLGDRVTDFIETQRQLLQEQANKATTTGGVEAQAVGSFQGRDTTQIKDLLKQLRSNPNDMNVMLQVNKALGYDVNKQLSPAEINQLYESSVDSIARGGAANVDDALTVEDLTALPSFGYNPQQLADLLGMPVEQVTGMNVGQLRSQISAVTDREFSSTQGLEQQAGSTVLGQAERGLARQEAREASRTGVRSSEADVANLEQQISNADQVQFGGKSYQVDELLQDDTISGLISDYMNSAPGSEVRNQIDRSEPALRDFIQKNEAVLSDAAQKLSGGAQEFTNIQQSNRDLQSSLFGGVKLDDSLASKLIPGFGSLSASRVDPNTVPVLQYAQSLGPDGARILATELNSKPAVADELKQLSSDELRNLGIGTNGQNWQSFKAQSQAKDRLGNIGSGDVNGLLQLYTGGDAGAARQVQDVLKENKSRSALGLPKSDLGKLGQTINGQGQINGEALFNVLNGQIGKPSLKEAAAGRSPGFQGNSVPSQPAVPAEYQGIYQKLQAGSRDGIIDMADIDSAGLGRNELIDFSDWKSIMSDSDRNKLAGRVNEAREANYKELVEEAGREVGPPGVRGTAPGTLAIDPNQLLRDQAVQKYVNEKMSKTPKYYRKPERTEFIFAPEQTVDTSGFNHTIFSSTPQ